MKQYINLSSLLIIILLVAGIFLWMRVSTLEDHIAELKEPSLYTTMNNMQNQTHKLYYAIESENPELTDFYLHELEEAAEDLIEADLFYHDQPVGRLTESMLEPVIDEMEDHLDNLQWERLRDKRRVLIGACNDCHGATGHDEIIMTERGAVNPFNQDFDTKE